MRPFHGHTWWEVTPLRRPLLSYIMHQDWLFSPGSNPHLVKMKHGMGTLVEAFLEVGSNGTGPARPPSYRAGYRYVDTGGIICAIELPASIAESTILAHSSIEIGTTPDGCVVSTVRGVAGSDSNEGQPIVSEPIDAFIARSLDLGNLRMEEATVADLETLLQRLNHSARLVRETIYQMAMANNSKGHL